MNFGYARVSTQEQNPARQIEQLSKLNLDKIYQDKLSGKDTDRPQLQAMLSNLRSGDTVTVLSLDRLGRKCDGIREIAKKMIDSGSVLHCLEPQFSTGDMFGEFFLQVLGAISELERKQILERQRQGIALARQQGKYQGRRPKQLQDFERVYQQWQSGAITSEQAGKLLGVSRATFYRRSREYELTKPIDFGLDTVA